MAARARLRERAHSSPYWSIPRLWDGETVVVIGGGPSVRELGHDEVIERLEGRVPTIAINCAYRLAPWADVLYWADNYWLCDNWRDVHNHVGWYKVSRMSASLHSVTRSVIPRWLTEVHVVRCALTPQIPDASDAVGGRNGGHNAVCLAAKAGAKRIVLVGFDLHDGVRRHNWHDLHTRPPRAQSYQRWVAEFGQLAAQAKIRGIEILNANPNSAIKCFPFVELGDVS